LILGSLGFGLVIILLGYYAAQQGFLPGLVDTATPGPGTRVAPTSTPAAGTPRPTSTRQIAVAPRDPQDLLQATYTPTPRYLATPHADALFQQGLEAFDAGDWATAAELFEQYLAVDSQAADAAYYLGQSRLELGDAALAQAAFEQAVASNPQFAYGYLGRARALIAQQGNTANILTDLNTALLLDANLIEGYLERAQFNLSRANPNQALEDVTSAEELAPRNALVQYYKALVYLVRGDDALALEAAERAYELDITLLPNYLAVVRAQNALGNYEAAIEMALSYLSFEGDDGQGWELLGLSYQLNGDEDLALEAFQRALEIDPNLPSAAYYRGIQELEDGQNEAALGDFRVAVAGRADWFEARIYLAQAHLATGNPSAAFFEINAGAPLAETDTQRALLFYWRATSLEALNQPENARPDWQSLLNLPSTAMPAAWRAEAMERLDQ
jgi:tetratricopeptide (TPR) repeat protein